MSNQVEQLTADFSAATVNHFYTAGYKLFKELFKTEDNEDICHDWVREYVNFCIKCRTDVSVAALKLFKEIDAQ